LSEDSLKKISDQLEKLIRLEAWIAVKSEPSEQAKVALLDSLGFRPVEIAKMLNKTPENVSVVLSNLRKKTAGKKGGENPPNLTEKASANPTLDSTSEGTSKS
jgi:hypothetical protein